MKLGIEDFEYSQLYDDARLQELALAFDRYLDRSDSALLQRFESYRIGMQSGIASGGLTKPEESALLVAVSRPLGKFLEQLFHTDATAIVARTQRDSEVARFKKEFVAKRVAKMAAVNPDAAKSRAHETVCRISLKRHPATRWNPSSGYPLTITTAASELAGGE